ncbi:O-antigen ligase domain-containing protein [Clostridiales bacterium]|nr:O-antigen ligase domain-containing protein [Clostridiales bacterium]
MESIYRVFSNTRCFKIIGIIIFLAATTPYSDFIYKYGIYILSIWGTLLSFDMLIKHKIKLNRIDWLVGIFLVGYMITMLVNIEDGLFRQGFVFLCCLMYFFIFFSAEYNSIEENRKINDIILKIILYFTFFAIIVSFIVLFCDLTNKMNHSYNLEGGTEFQFMGIYKALSTQASLSGISALCSIHFIIQCVKTRRKSTWLVFNIVNFIIQGVAMILAYTSASIVMFIGSSFIAILIISIKISAHKQIVKTIRNIAIGTLLMFVCFFSLNGIANLFSDLFINGTSVSQVEYTPFTSNARTDNSKIGKDDVKMKQNSALAEIFRSNGRIPIWQEAISVWKNHPIFGVGYGNFHMEFDVQTDKGTVNLQYEDVHNGYLEVLVACGLVGFISIMLFGGYYLVRLLIGIFCNRIDCLDIGVILILIAVCISAMANQLFILDRSLHSFLLCIFLGFIRSLYVREKKGGKENAI